MSTKTEKPEKVASIYGARPPGTSDRKRRANRANSKQSTGPKTELGKFNSSFNAMKHGLLSRRIVTKTDDEMDRLNQLSLDLYERYGRDGDVRTELLLELAVVDYWRHSRSLDAEAPLFSPRLSVIPMSRPEFSANLFRYMTSNRRALMKTLDMLEDARDKRIYKSQSADLAADDLPFPSRGERRGGPPKKPPKRSSLEGRDDQVKPVTSVSRDMTEGKKTA